jgi:mono/diheme cytochrome c family protein
MKRPEALAIIGGILFLACIASMILVGSIIPQPIPPTPQPVANAAAAPTSDLLPADRQRARELYALNCAGCHGAQGEGMLLIHPALTTTRVRQELSIEELHRILLEGAGIADIMPPFQRILTDGEIDLMVRWLRGGMG